MSYEEKAVNTRSQGVAAAVTSLSGDEDSVADNSLVARRRRRRERAQTTYIMQASAAGATQPSPVIINTAGVPQPLVAEVEGHQMTLAQERRLLRAAYSASLDNDDVFYDAMPASTNAHKL